MKINCAFYTHKGNVRQNNEDSMLVHDVIYTSQSFTNAISSVIDDEKFVFAVADGMGGHAKGEIASNLALESIKDDFLGFAGQEDIKQAIYSAKGKLDDYARGERSSFGLGTTLCGMFINGKHAHVFNVGDSRLYRRQDGFLQRLTKDHSFVQYLVDSGMITEEEMSFHPKKNIVTSALTGDLITEMPEIYFNEIILNKGDQFLLCTDGVWESLSTEELEVCMLDKELVSKTDVLTENILRYGGFDNLTMIILEVVEV
ncbi:MAG: protein phosphatase 2C domain-containing protein [Spirochaetota bacterium]